MYRAILVPLDGSEFGEQALPVALSIAQRAGALVRLAHVQAGEDAGARALASSPTPVDTQVQATERIYLEQLAQRLASRYPVLVEHILRQCHRCGPMHGRRTSLALPDPCERSQDQLGASLCW
jgi:nucleotide-binding universal stress UspA family protein